MIYYFPGVDHALPSGGVRTHYDHVEHLVAMNYDAAILHLRPGFRPPWFTSTAPVAYAPDVELSASDVLVMNEIMGPQTVDIVPGVPKVIFAQNVHYTWRGWPIPPETPPPYTHPDVKAVLVLTEYEREFFHWAFPQTPCYVTPHGYDFEKFQPGDKKRQIAFMPRKHADEAQQVFGWLGAVGALKGWSVVGIDGKTEDETAAILRESTIFAAFGYPEGGTKPPFEAMAAGCVVVGYGGFASDDDLDECGGHLVPSGDSCRFAQALAPYCRMPQAHLQMVGLAASTRVRRRFTKENERRAIRAAWTAIRSQAS